MFPGYLGARGEWSSLGASAGGGFMAEPGVVVAHREHLWWLLAEAAQLEHMIMCQ